MSPDFSRKERTFSRYILLKSACLTNVRSRRKLLPSLSYVISAAVLKQKLQNTEQIFLTQLCFMRPLLLLWLHLGMYLGKPVRLPPLACNIGKLCLNFVEKLLQFWDAPWASLGANNVNTFENVHPHFFQISNHDPNYSLDYSVCRSVKLLIGSIL